MTINPPSNVVADEKALLRSLLASSGDCIKILDLDGNLLFMTEGGQRVMEVTDFGTIKGCPWPDFWHGQGNIDAKAALASARAGNPGRFRGFATTMAGTPKWWDVTVTLIRDADGNADKLLSVSRDITDVRNVDEALRASEERLRLALNAGRLGYWDLDLSTGTMTTSATCRTTFGRDPNIEFSHEELLAAVVPDDKERVASAISHTIATGDDYEIEYKITRPDGAPGWVLIRGQLIRDDAGTASKMSGVSLDIGMLKAAEQALVESQQRVKFALSAADIGTWDFDPQSGSLRWDDRCYELFGLTPGKPISFDIFLAGIHAQDRDATETACLDAMRPGGSGGYDIEYRTVGFEDGVERWCSAKGKATFENGVTSRFIGTIRDVSKLKRAELQQQLLTRELEHRMKNTMAMVAAIAGQTFRTAATKEEARTIFDARLFALNKAHDVLVQTHWTSAPLQTVVDTALSPHHTGEGRILASGPAVELSARQALSLALALHELATNATKYGALSIPGGTIHVRWDCRASNDGRKLSFTWREAGGPVVQTPTRRGFGTRLIEGTLSADFGGATKIHYNPEGLSCTFEALLPALAESVYAKELIRNEI